MSVKTDKQIRKDHEAIRNKVGYYDFTHELLSVTGKEKGEFMDKVFANTMKDAKNGVGKYTQMLDEDANILDDLIVFKRDEDTYWISTLYADEMIKIFDKHIGDFDAEYHDIREDWLMFAVQGPESRKLLNKIVKKNLDDLKWFRITENEIKDFKIYIARAGFTGELGFEVYVKPGHKDTFVKLLEEAGQEFDLENTTSDAILTSLPREKGYVLMSDLEGLNPIEAGFKWAVDWDTDFVGKDALKKIAEEGTNNRLHGFELLDSSMDDPSIEEKAKVEKDGEEVGYVTTLTYGFSVDKFIGYAVVDKTKAKKGDTVTINNHEAKLTDRMFYDTDNERLTK